MAKRMLIDASHPEETRVAIADKNQIFEFDYITATKKQMKGNIYLAKITRVEPSLQAAFVEYGGGKQGFLPFSEIHPDYYQIPVSDRKKLIEEVERELEEAEAEEEAELEEKPKPQRNARRVRGRGRGRTRRNSASEDTDTPEAEGETGDNAAEAGDALPEDAVDVKAVLPEETGKVTDSESGADDSKSDSPKTQKEDSGAGVKDAVVSSENGQAEGGFAGGDASHVSIGSVLSDDTVADAEEDAVKAAREAAENDAEAEDADESTNHNDAAQEEGDDGEVETLANEEEEMSSKRKRRVPFFKRYKIQEVIKRGQIVLVQVIKEERGNKGVSLTSYLSLAGRYCVLMPNSPRDGGVSRKISDIDTRRRLKDLISQLKLARGMSVIIRTAGVDRSRPEIRRDFDYLVKLWNQIREGTLASTAPALIYEESNIIKRAIRDLYTSDIDEVLVEGEEGFQATRDFMKMLLPSHTPRVKHYNEKTPLFYAYNIEDQLLSMHDPVVKLKSGGYIVIDPTEALISIDVNSGRSTGERNIEETATKTNLEAAHEIARQLRLRDLAGLIVIDFIDMLEGRNRRAVERVLKDALRSDRAKIQVGRISPFGLMEMSRQRLRPSISESSTIACPHCQGRGVVRSSESLALQIVRVMEKEASTGQYQELRLAVPESVALHLLNNKRTSITDIERRYEVNILIEIDRESEAFDYTIEKIRQSRGKPDNQRDNRNRPRRGNDPVDAVFEAALPEEVADVEMDEETEGGQSSENKPRRRRGRRGGRNRNARDQDQDTDVEDNVSDNEEISAETQEEGDEQRESSERGGRNRRGQRGGRGRNRSRGNDAASDDAADQDDGAQDAANGDGEEGADLPDFTRSAAVDKSGADARENVMEITSIEAREESVTIPTEPTHRPEGVPARKGWWQQIIELE